MNAKEFAELIAIISTEGTVEKNGERVKLSISRATEYATMFRRNARALVTIGERQANEDMGEEAYNALSKKEERTEKRVQFLAAELGFGYVAGGDVRGYPFYLVLPSGRYNGWGKEGWGVA